MGTIVRADDLSKDTLVTIHSLIRPSRVVRQHSPDGIEVLAVDQPPVPLGVPLQVRGVSLPFVVCAFLNPGGEWAGPVILDLRTMRLSHVSEDFVSAIASFPTVGTGETEGGEPECEDDLDELPELA